ANGDVFFEAQRQADNSYILVNWIGIQSLETIMMGAGQLSAMLRHRPCEAILNSNRELIGPWDDGALFLGRKWAAEARIFGVKQFAQVMAPGIFGKRSFEKFDQTGQHHLTIRSFETEQEAKTWLAE